MGQGYVSLGVDRGPLDAGLEAAKSQFQAWGKGIAALGAAIAASGAAVASPFLAGMGDFIAWGSETRTAMRMANVTFEESRLLMNGMRLSADELPATMAKVDEFMVAAAGGSREATAALADMGLTLEELQAMSRSDRMLAFADGLGRIGDESLRVARTRDIFGRGGLSANIDGGSAGIRGRAARSAELQGDSRSEEAFHAAAAMGRAKGEMGAAVGAIFQSLAFAAAPVMADFYNLITKIAIAVRQWTDANRPLLTTIFYIADKAILLGSIIATLGGAIYGISYVITFFQGAIAIVSSFIFGVFNVALGGMAFLLGIVKGGFGLATLFSIAWGVATSIWAGIVTVAMAAYSVVLWAMIPVFTLLKAASMLWGASTSIVLASATALTWMYNAATVAAAAAYSVYTFMAGIATGATNIYTIALIAAWVWENLVSLGINLIISGLVLLVTALVAAGVAITGMIGAALGIALIGPIISGAFVAISTGIGGMVTSARNAVIGVGNAITDFLSRTIAYIGQFFTTFAETAAVAFSQISALAVSSFRAIRDAFDAGDMSLVWDIFLLTAQIAWIRLYPAVISFKDGMVDLFRDAWMEISILGMTAWQRIKEFVFPIFAAMLQNAGIALAAVPGMQAQANALIAAAGAIPAQPANEIQRQAADARIRREAEQAGLRAWFDEQALRVARDEAAAAGDAPLLAQLQAELDDNAMYAAFLRSTVTIPKAMTAEEMRRQMGGAGPGGTISSIGGFNRFGFAGVPGAVGFDSETPTARNARLAAEAIEGMRREAAERAIAERAMAERLAELRRAEAAALIARLEAVERLMEEEVQLLDRFEGVVMA